MIEYSRLHSNESEQALLGALLMYPEACDNIGGLKPEHMANDAHRMIFTEILRMSSCGMPIDAVTVAQELATRGFEEATGGLAYLGQLALNTTGLRGVRRYADVIVGKSLERRLLSVSDEIREIVSGSGSTRDKLTAAQSSVMSITDAIETKQPKMIREALVDAVEVLTQRASGNVFCLTTGFGDLNRRLGGGFRPGNLIVVAGRPAMGKTSLAVNMAYHAAQTDSTALFLSMEMPQQELTDRLIAQAGSVYLSDVIAGKMDGDSGERIMAAVSRLHDMPLVIDDQGGLNLFEVASKARSVKRRHGLSLLVIDYLQLMSGEGDNRNQQIEQITRGLKTLAKELNIPVIVLSQLSRKCEERTNKRPLPSDLRESGAIEQDADVILSVYRDEEYNPESPDKGTAEIIIGKNRQGQTGMVRLSYQGCYTRFNDLDPGWQPEHREEPVKRSRRGME